MQNIRKLVFCLTFFTLFFGRAIAQKVDLPKGYYVNQKGEKVEGYFDLELFRENIINIKESQDAANSKKLLVEDVEKIVLIKNEKDSSVIMTQNLIYKEQKETIYIEYLLRGAINLFRGFSKNENEIFYISSNDLPQIRRINKANPKTYLFTYFQKCDDVKRTIKHVYYDKASLEQTVILFANCLNTNSNKIERLKDVKYDFSRHLSFGLKVLGGYVKPQMVDYFGAEFKPSSVSTGIGASMQLNITNRLSLATEFNYDKNSFKASDSMRLWLTGRYDSRFLFTNFLRVNYTKIEYIPVELKYSFPKEFRGLQQVISVGFIINKIINPQLSGKFGEYSDYVLNTAFPPRFALDEPPSPPLQSDELVGKNAGFGFFATAAVQKHLNNHVSLGLGAKYTIAKENMRINNNGKTPYDNSVFFPRVQRFDLYAHLLFTL